VEKVAIVLGNTITALGTLRACEPLKKEGFRLLLVSTSRNDNIAIRSNVPDQKIVLADGLVSGILKMAGMFADKPVLLFTRDDEVIEISKNRENLSKHYRFLLPEEETVDTLMEKGKFAEFALHQNLNTPKTSFITNETELLKIGEKIRFPIIIKPYLRHAVKIENPMELRQLSAKMLPVHYRSMIAQEFIEGGDDQLFFCFMLFDRNRQLVRSMYARKLRQWPVAYGTTSLAITVMDDKLVKEVEKFIATVSLEGFCSVEYKYDAAGDRYLIMEPTIGRFNQQVELTVACGVNFPEAVVRLLTGGSVAHTEQKNGVLWVYESNDLFSYFRSDTKYGYVKNFLKPGVSVLFSLRDPGPLFFECYSLGIKKLRKIFTNV
jgi:predicted ATP-grasp superfamily ATP-dependent carboligase